ncbi:MULTISPECIES: hypothetical protein [Neobacillus]|uniref:Spore germination protein n=1 Tax=Neobacillus rhizophilus TaxID=2833579 RepID=A0A942U9V8_9BACI|nr:MULTISPECIES: hypothetical protein [Neobacillus]MBS4214878.1 hypothetical protein [Neobacillus rhizophilus]MBU8918886.1 hypothetical protein [Bacillus sp. FJAT-29953]
MASVVNVGILNINSPQPSSAIFVGEGIVNGMDANRKYNLNSGGIYGINTINAGNINSVADSFEIIDGVIFDQDIKPIIATNI